MYDSWSVEDLVFFLTFLKFSEQISCFSAIDTGTCLLIRSDTICSNLNFKDDSISKWNFWEVISSWGWRLHEKVSVLTTEALERSQASFYHMRTQQESPSFEPGRELSPKCDYAYLALVLDSQPPEPWEMYFCCPWATKFVTFYCGSLSKVTGKGSNTGIFSELMQ